MATNVDAKNGESDSKTTKDTSAKNDIAETATQKGCATKPDDKIVPDSSSNDNAIKGDSSCIKERRISTTEQTNASGDRVDVKVERKESSSSAERLETANGGSSDTKTKTDVLPAEKTRPEETGPEIQKGNQTSPEATTEEIAPVATEESNANGSVLDTSKTSLNSNVTECSGCSAETAKAQAEVTKHSLRLEMWEYLDKNDLVMFPRPCKGRIPNFKGAPAAAEKLTSLDVFRNSKTIKINPDKPQEMVRYHTLEVRSNIIG